MTAFEEFSTHIATIADGVQTNRLIRVQCRIERWLRHRRNRPIQFEEVGYEGIAVGEPLIIPHRITEGILPLTVRFLLTDLVLLEGARINAFQNLETETLKGDWGQSVIQPKWVNLE